MIKKFLAQEEELEAFITGPAGSGKTTYLHDIIEYLDSEKINYRVVAYTHKAKDVLISKLPKDTPVSTLHSWLKKRPGVNEKAKHMKALLTSNQYGKPEPLELLIVDEFSFVGEKDYWSIGELQDEVLLEESVTTYKCDNCGGECDTDYLCLECDSLVPRPMYTVSLIVGDIPKPLKVLYVGDLNQLSPIDGPPAVDPHEPFWTELTTIHRATTTISGPLAKLVLMIEGVIPMAYLEPTEHFKRKQDIDKLYKSDKSKDKILLSYTNYSVQLHNETIQGYKSPKIGDTIFSSSLKKSIIINRIYDTISELDDKVVLRTPTGTIDKDTKFNPMKTIGKIKEVKYYEDNLGNVYPGIFGSYNNKLIREKLGKILTDANKTDAPERQRKEAYKNFKSVNDFVSIFDFNHCMTIHKSQGSEYNNVYIDSKDLGICKDKLERMKLLYVAMSRSKNYIFMND